MTEVLGYSTYAVHGTNWLIQHHCAGSTFCFPPFVSPSTEEIAANNNTLSDIQKVTEQRVIEFNAVGNGYFIEQSTKSANAFKTVYTKAPTNAPLLFSQYEYNVGLWPEEYVARVGNLVSYKVHDFGGHVAGLDNPQH
ncbi:hypothetical protein B0H14DRAFT_3448119 [Mycena olivaceomarginata]|nr:hypothetical protein B0H14DRAFT_3448119 [Mycena olivaceomarginata]